MLVLLVVKVVKVEEVGLLRLLDGLQAVRDGDGTHRDSIRGISEIVFNWKIDNYCKLYITIKLLTIFTIPKLWLLDFVVTT